MKKETRQTYRAAADIVQSLQRVCVASSMTSLDESFAQCKRWQHRLEISTRRNWPTAARDSEQRLRGALDNLSTQATRSLDEQKRRTRTQIKPKATLIFTEIEALRDGFESVTIDRANQRLSVETSSIELEGVYLAGQRHFVA